MSSPLTPATYIEKANRALNGARGLLETGDTEGACSRAYYAMFYAAHCALLSVGTIKAGAIYKTHSGLVSAFSLELVKTGRLPDRLSRALSKVLNTRLLADYDGDPVDQADAVWAVEQAEAFVAEIEREFPGSA